MMEGGDAPELRRHAAAYRDIVSRLQRLAGEEYGPRLTARFTSMFEQMMSMVVWEEHKANLSWQDRDYYEDPSNGCSAGGATPCPRPVRRASARSSGRMHRDDSNPEA